MVEVILTQEQWDAVNDPNENIIGIVFNQLGLAWGSYIPIISQSPKTITYEERILETNPDTKKVEWVTNGISEIAEIVIA